MAKIIVTKENGAKLLVDSNSKFETSSMSTRVYVIPGRGDMNVYPIRESMEEIQKLINEAEAETTNAKLELILANQEKLLKALKIK